MRRWSALAVVLMLCTACNGNVQQGKGIADNNGDITTEVTTEYIQQDVLNANAETLTAYGQILNNACVYLNENYADKITGDVRVEYDEACKRLHNINLKGISAFAQMSDEKRNEIFSQLEEIESCIFDSVADKIGVKAELTEAITTTADKKADERASGEVITTSPTEAVTAAEVERITAAD